MSKLGVLVSENRRLKEALLSITKIPSGQHVSFDPTNPHDRSYVLDGHKRCVETAKRALGLPIEAQAAHPMDLHARGRQLLGDPDA